MKKNILMILGHDFFEPFIDPRVYKEAKSLLKMGHNVTLLCLSTKKREVVYEGINVISVKRFFNSKKLIKDRPLLSFLLLIIESPLLYFGAFLRGLFVSADYIHAHDLDALPLGVMLRIFKFGTRLIYDSHELAMGMALPRYLIFIVKTLERLCLPFVTFLITANSKRLEVMKNEYRYLLAKKRCFVIHNYPSQSSVDRSFVAQFPQDFLRDRVVFVYQGPLDDGRGIKEILKAFSQLKEKNWSLVIIGGNSERVKSLRSSFSDEKIFFTGFLSNHQVFSYMELADFGILALLNNCLNNYYTAPNKLYEYMQCGCAILGPDFIEMREFIVGEKLGFVVDFSSQQSIRKKLKTILQTPKSKLGSLKERSRLLSNHYGWDKNEHVLKSIYGE